MANKTKQFKKFASSGKLKETITKRRQHQQIRRKAEDRTARRAKQRGAPNEWDKPAGEGDGDEDDDARDLKSADATAGGRAGGVAKNVEELFGQGGLDVDADAGSDLEELSEDEDDDEDDDEEEEKEDEVDDEMNEAAMKKAMKDLQKKDPEFFKYLKENDQDLLTFGDEAGEPRSKGKGKSVARENDEDDEMASGSEAELEDDDEDDNDNEGGKPAAKKIEVTMKMIRQWQEGMLKVRPSESFVLCRESPLLMYSNTLFAHYGRLCSRSVQLRT
jgi:nucleolar complex protein 2